MSDFCERGEVSYAWIDPSGEVHRIQGGSDHEKWALDWVRAREVPGYENTGNDLDGYDDLVAGATEHLMSEGWMRVSNYAAIGIWTRTSTSHATWKAFFGLLSECTRVIHDPEVAEIYVSFRGGARGFKKMTFAALLAEYGDRVSQAKFYEAFMSRKASNPCSKMSVSYAWIDPTGKVIDLGSSDSQSHFGWALGEMRAHPVSQDLRSEVVDALYKYGRPSGGEVAGGILMRLGWIRVSNYLNIEVWDVDNVPRQAWAGFASILTSCASRGQIPDAERASIECFEIAGSKRKLDLPDFLKRHVDKPAVTEFYEAMMTKMAKRVAKRADFAAPCQEYRYSYAWINPQGIVHKNVSDHYEWAENWLEHRPAPANIKAEIADFLEGTGSGDGRTAAVTLMRLGWMRVSNYVNIEVWSDQVAGKGTWKAFAGILSSCAAAIGDPEQKVVFVARASSVGDNRLTIADFLKKYTGKAIQNQFYEAILSKTASPPCVSYDFSYAWINPQGVVHRLSGETHYPWARAWLEHRPAPARLVAEVKETLKRQNSRASQGETAAAILMRMGWLRISNVRSLEVWSTDVVGKGAWRAFFNLLTGCATSFWNPEEENIGLAERDPASYDTYTVAEFLQRYTDKATYNKFYEGFLSKTANRIAQRVLADGSLCSPTATSYAWIDPKGGVHKGIGDHFVWAAKYLGMKPPTAAVQAIAAKHSGIEHPDAWLCLEIMGWLRVSNFHALEYWDEAKVSPATWQAYLGLLTSCAYKVSDPELSKVYAVEVRTEQTKDLPVAEILKKHGDRATATAFYDAFLAKAASRIAFNCKSNSGFWIDPEGKVYPLRGRTHEHFAYRWLITHHQKPDNTESLEDANKILLLRWGWVRVGNIGNIEVWNPDEVSPAAWASFFGLLTPCAREFPDPEADNIYIGDHSANKTHALVVSAFLRKYGNPSIENAFYRTMLKASTSASRIAAEVNADVQTFTDGYMNSKIEPHTNFSMDDPTLSMGYSKTYKHDAVTLKRLWAANVDRPFIQSLTKIHWLRIYYGAGTETTNYAKRFMAFSHKDECTATGHLPGVPIKPHDFLGGIGIVLDGWVTLAGNDMDNIVSRLFSDIDDLVRDAHKPSGMPRRPHVLQVKIRDLIAKTYILDRKSFKPTSQPNELFLDNWKPKALIVLQDQIYSPLTPDELRLLSQDLGLPIWDKNCKPLI